MLRGILRPVISVSNPFPLLYLWLHVAMLMVDGAALAKITPVLMHALLDARAVTV